jgi:hypothetical protein
MMIIARISITEAGQIKRKEKSMIKETKKEPYSNVKIEIFGFSSGDIVTASDLFTDSNNPGDSTSSGSWT